MGSLHHSQCRVLRHDAGCNQCHTQRPTDTVSARTFSSDNGFLPELFFDRNRPVSAIMLGLPKGCKLLIERMREREPVGADREALLERGNL